MVHNLILITILFSFARVTVTQIHNVLMGYIASSVMIFFQFLDVLELARKTLTTVLTDLF